MYQTFRAEPRPQMELETDGVQLPEPLELPEADGRPGWMKLLPLLMVVAMIGMFAMYAMMGTSSLIRMLPMGVMMVAMMGMYASQMGGGGKSDLTAEREDYDLELREKRLKIYEQGEAMHDLRTLCYPNPSDLVSLVGTATMWSADPDPNIGPVVPPSEQDDPDVENLTSNPFLRARVGIGFAPLFPKLIPTDEVVAEKLEPGTMVRYERAMNTLSVVANLPIDVRLDEYPAYALRGDEDARMALCRSMLMSLAYNHSPSTLRIGIITDDPAQWEWLKWLPHCEDLSRVESGLGARMLAWRSVDEFAVSHAAQLEAIRSGDGSVCDHLLVVVDLPDSAVDWPATLADGMEHMTWLVSRCGTDGVSEPDSVILVRDGRVSTRRDFDAAAVDSASISTAQVFAQEMAAMRPRGYGRVGAAEVERNDKIPNFFEVLGIDDIDAFDIISRWRENAYTDEIKVPFGYMRHGDELTPELSYLNFYEENRYGNGPHGAVAGRTGAGKSYFLRAVVLSLVAMYGPDKVALILADFKGGATFLGMDRFPHTVASISNLENAMELVDRLGDVINGEVDRREEFITTEMGCKDIFDYREKQKEHQGDPAWPPLPDLIIIIDEFGEFLKSRKGYLELLTRVGRVGRSLGMHLVMCSQFIDKSVLNDLFEHLSFRYSLAVNSANHSTAMIGTDAASKMIGGKLKGKILRKFSSDAQPVEVAAFHHEGEYVRREVTVSGTDSSSAVIEHVDQAVVPFALLPDREFTPRVVDGEVVEDVTESGTGEKMSDVLIDKISGLRDMQVVDLWKPSLREPLSLPTFADGDYPLTTETTGLRIRIGDLDAPAKQTRLPWVLDFGSSLPHQVIAGGGKSGRTTLLQTLVILGAIQHGPARLAFMLADYGTGKLGEVKASPNVAAYARPGDTDTVDRILGEARRLIALRQAVMVDRDATGVDAYLASKAQTEVPGDPYGYVIVAIDGIGGFLGEDRAERSRLLRPLLDKGAAVGVHLVFTADSQSSGTSGNTPHYTMEMRGGVQLPSTDYTGAKMRPEIRMSLSERIPADQPGRSFDTGTELAARTVVPINYRIEADRQDGGLDVFDVTDRGDQVRELASQLADRLGGQRVVQVLPAEPVIDFERVWETFTGLIDPHRHPMNTMLPLGVRMDTLELATVPDLSQNLLIYGEKGSGKTNALRSVIESVSRQFTPEQASIIVIDPLRQLLGERDRLYARGHMQRAKFTGEGDERRRVRPPGYVTSAEDIKETAAMLVRMMGKRRPSDEATAHELRDRTFFTGREVYVFIDTYSAMAAGMMAKSVFDDVEVGGVTVTKMLSQGIDLGVHFIIADNSGMAKILASSPMLMALRDGMQAPIMQLASPPSSGSPIPGAYHLKPERWRTGQGRLIVDTEDYAMVQTSHIDVDAVAERFGG